MTDLSDKQAELARKLEELRGKINEEIQTAYSLAMDGGTLAMDVDTFDYFLASLEALENENIKEKTESNKGFRKITNKVGRSNLATYKKIILGNLIVLFSVFAGISVNSSSDSGNSGTIFGISISGLESHEVIVGYWAFLFVQYLRIMWHELLDLMHPTIHARRMERKYRNYLLKHQKEIIKLRRTVIEFRREYSPSSKPSAGRLGAEASGKMLEDFRLFVESGILALLVLVSTMIVLFYTDDFIENHCNVSGLEYLVAAILVTLFFSPGAILFSMEMRDHFRTEKAQPPPPQTKGDKP